MSHNVFVSLVSDGPNNSFLVVWANVQKRDALINRFNAQGANFEIAETRFLDDCDATQSLKSAWTSRAMRDGAILGIGL